QAFAKCFSKAAKSGAQPDPTCGQKAASSFNGSLKACGTPTQLGPLEGQIDSFGVALSRSLTVPTTSTTTTTTSTTTTTLPPPPARPPSLVPHAVRHSHRHVLGGGRPDAAPPAPAVLGRARLRHRRHQDHRPRARLPLHRRRRRDGGSVAHSGECHHHPRQPR